MEFSHPKMPRKVSGLSRNGPQVREHEKLMMTVALVVVVVAVVNKPNSGSRGSPCPVNVSCSNTSLILYVLLTFT